MIDLVVTVFVCFFLQQFVLDTNYNTTKRYNKAELNNNNNNK